MEQAEAHQPFLGRLDVVADAAGIRLEQGASARRDRAVLVQVADPRRRGHRAGIRSLLARDHPQQARLADAVRAGDQQAVAGPELQRLDGCPGDAHPGELEDRRGRGARGIRPARLTRGSPPRMPSDRRRERQRLRRRGDRIVEQSRDARLRVADARHRAVITPAGPERARAHAGLVELAGDRLESHHVGRGEVAIARELRRPRLVRESAPLPLVRLRDQETGVAVSVAGDGCRLDLPDRLGERLEERAIMRDRDDRARVPAQSIDEPPPRVVVELVARLVQQQKLGVRCQRRREGHARALAARQGRPSAGVLEPPDTEHLEGSVESRRRAVAVARLEPCGELGVRGERELRGRRPSRCASSCSARCIARSRARRSAERASIASRTVAPSGSSSTWPSAPMPPAIATMTSPASGESSPLMRRSSVDLPEPLSPMMPMRSPGRTASSMRSRTTRSPNRFVSRVQ